MEEFKNNNNSNETLSDNTDMNDELIAQPKSSMKKELLDWIISIAVALVVAFLIRQYIFTLVRVDGSSMEPTLQHADTLFVNRFMYTPENGDVIIFRPHTNPEVHYVKRVIATEGQEVNIDPREGKVYVDGVELNETYIDEPLNSPGKAVKYPYIIPEDHVYVLGDNRNNSQDSRAIGAVHEDSIVGKVIFRILPLSGFGSIYK